MSVYDLLFPNSFSLNSNKLTTNELISKLVDLVEARVDKLTGTEIISNKIQGTLGFNYLSPWDATKSYITLDLVIYAGQILKCLIDNTNVPPDINNPAQTQWVQTTSNNAILNDRAFCQINNITGNDAKALVSPQPFTTVRTAIQYLNSSGGGLAKITTIGQNITYPWTGSDFIGLNNVIIDGGDTSQSGLNNPFNIISGDIIFTDCNNVTIKNIGLTRTVSIGYQLFMAGCKNISFENVTFIDPTSPLGAPFIYFRDNGATTFGSCSFYNCNMKTDNDTTMQITAIGACDPNTILLIDNSNTPNVSTFAIDTVSGSGITTPANFRLVVKDTTVDVAQCTHYSGSDYVFINCIISGSLNSNATSGKITMINCSFYNPRTNNWGFPQFFMTGTATYQLIDCLLNPNSNSNALNSTLTTSNNFSSGPATRFNRLATWSAGVATSTGTTQAIVPVLPGAILSNTLNILTYNSGTGAITFSSNGVYQILVGMDVANTNTANEQTVMNYWLGINGSTEATSLATSSTDRGFVGSAGILATYPNSRRGLPLVVTITNSATSYFFYVRNLSATAYNVTIQTMAVLQIR